MLPLPGPAPAHHPVAQHPGGIAIHDEGWVTYLMRRLQPPLC